MQRVAVRTGVLGLIAAVVTAGSLGASALFESPRPGAALQPVSGAETLVRLVQGRGSLLWTTLTGPVEVYEVLGWPGIDGDNELGGALMIRKPENGTSGVIDIGEKPKSVRFQLSD